MRLSDRRVIHEYYLIIKKILPLLLLIIDFVYILIRATTLTLTHDEAYTFLYCINPRDYTDTFVANNHLLNTYLVLIFTSLFGNSELIIRIPALLGSIFYLIGTYKTSKLLFRDTIFLPISVVLLIFNPLILEFLPLSRGYSLALGLMVMGLYFFSKEIINDQVVLRNNYYSFIFLTLAVFAILTFLYVLLSVIIVSIFIELGKIQKNKENNIISKNGKFTQKLQLILTNMINPIIKPIIIPIIILALLGFFFLIPLYIYSGGVYWGVADFNRTILSQIKYITQEYDYIRHNYLEITILTIIYEVLFFLSTFIFISILIWKAKIVILNKRKLISDDKQLLAITSLLFFTIGLLFLQFAIQSIINSIYLGKLYYNANFPVDRTGIFLMPLFLLFFISLWYYVLNLILNEYKKYKTIRTKSENSRTLRNSKRMLLTKAGITQIYFCFLFTLLIFHSFCNLNLTHTYYCKPNAPIKTIAEDLIELNPDQSEKDVYIPTFLEIPLLYYKERYGLTWLSTDHDYKQNYEYDFFILESYQIDIIEERDLTIIYYYPIGDVYLCN